MYARGGERGQAVPLVAVTMLAMALAAVALVAIANRSGEVARARTAADAAALAATRGGEPAARSLAAANGGALEAYTDDGLQVVVTVRVGRSRATATAELVVRAPP